jgi:hypothetical protein
VAVCVKRSIASYSTSASVQSSEISASSSLRHPYRIFTLLANWHGYKHEKTHSTGVYSSPCNAFPNLGSQSSFRAATRQRLAGETVKFTMRASSSLSHAAILKRISAVPTLSLSTRKALGLVLASILIIVTDGWSFVHILQMRVEFGLGMFCVLYSGSQGLIF